MDISWKIQLATIQIAHIKSPKGNCLQNKVDDLCDNCLI